MDLQELADELEEFRDLTVTCPDCKGDGTIEVSDEAHTDADEATVTEETCPECCGDGEISVHEDDEVRQNLSDPELDRFNELVDLEGQIGDLSVAARDGYTLIAESDFEDHARQLAEDIGAIDSNAGWPLHCIDWERAADELKMDYTMVEFDGDTYYTRD